MFLPHERYIYDVEDCSNHDSSKIKNNTNFDHLSSTVVNLIDEGHMNFSISKAAGKSKIHLHGQLFIQFG